MTVKNYRVSNNYGESIDYSSQKELAMALGLNAQYLSLYFIVKEHLEANGLAIEEIPRVDLNNPFK